MSCSNMYECEHFKRYLDHEAYGKVTKKYLDSTSHMWPTIVYQTLDGKVVDQEIAMYIPALYDTLEIGDTIAKTSESTMVTVTKHRGLVIKLDTAKESRRLWCQK